MVHVRDIVLTFAELVEENTERERERETETEALLHIFLIHFPHPGALCGTSTIPSIFLLILFIRDGTQTLGVSRGRVTTYKGQG